MTYVFKLAQKAKKTGDDKYSCKIDNFDWIVYFPRSIARDNNLEPKSEITISTENKGSDCCTFLLVKKAKKTGGDKYSCKIDNSDWVVYFPSCVSRPDNLEPKNEITISYSEPKIEVSTQTEEITDEAANVSICPENEEQIPLFSEDEVTMLHEQIVNSVEPGWTIA